MRIGIGLIAAVIGVGAVGEVAAQSRVVVPIVVPPPSGASSGARGAGATRVIIQSPGGVAAPSSPLGSASGRNVGAPVTGSREIRVLTAPQSSQGTQVFIHEQAAGTGQAGAARALPPASREIRVFIDERTAGTGQAGAARALPPASQVIRVLVDGDAVETPIVILTE